MNNIPEEPLTDAPPVNGYRNTSHRGARRWHNQHSPRHESAYAPLYGAANPRSPATTFDFWSLLDPLIRRWKWPLLAAAALLAAGFVFAATRWHTTYVATAQVVYTAPSGTDTGYRPRTIGMQTLTGLLRSPEVLRRVGAYTQPALTPNEVRQRIVLQPERDSEILNITARAGTLDQSVGLSNVFAREAVLYAQEMQAREAAEAAALAARRITQIDADLSVVQNRLLNLPTGALTQVTNVTPAASPSTARLETAREELAVLLGRYTDVHPLVREQRARIEVLEQQVHPVSPINPALANVPALAPGDDLELLRHQARNLETARAHLVNQQHAAKLVQANPPGYLQVLNQAQPETARVEKPHIQIGAFAIFLGLVGLVGTAVTMIGREFFDNRLKTASDVRRVAHLPVIATLGDTDTMTESQRDRWAFRTWTALQRRLSVSPNHGLVCGITSSSAGEGRSTWVRLLAQAATDRGFRVLTLTTQPGGPASAVDAEVVGPEGETPNTLIVAGEQTPVLTSNVLASPGLIVEQLQRADAPPRIDIPLPGWVWNLDRRKQWQEALNAWRKVDNLVILVELPPASVPEAVLLAENLPNLVWLAECGQSDAAETRMQLETLRQARCNLVGAVLNRENGAPLRQKFTRWIGCGLLAFTPLFVTPDAMAQTAEPNPGAGRLSVNNPAERAEWQKRLTLGPGDVLTIGIFGEPELQRAEVPIGPDGRLSYLEARGIKAAGLTVDELRGRLDEALGEFRRSPRTMVTPVAYRSKSYVVLGKVQRRGVYPLDRPVTVVEAVARAGGFETGLRRGSIVDAADLSRSFLARGNERVSVDFERLFRSGDLSQNVVLAPGDYLFFPAAGLQEVYVVGEVRQPGPQGFIPQSTTALAAIAGRGGFTDRAWKGRVLVVRGSLERPETFVIDTNDVLSGRSMDFALQPRDIVYVSHRPWIRAEELLDIAASSFVQSAILNWTGLKTGPIIR